jgi:hypothetical protein
LEVGTCSMLACQHCCCSCLAAHADTATSDAAMHAAPTAKSLLSSLCLSSCCARIFRLPRSISNRALSPGRCTLTTTSSPLCSTTLCTWPKLAAAMGRRSKLRNSCRGWGRCVGGVGGEEATQEGRVRLLAGVRR